MNSMKWENVRVYNIDRAIFGLHHLDGDYENADTKTGFAKYTDVLDLIKQRSASPGDMVSDLNNMLIHQDQNSICEYCIIGPKDMDKIKHLSPWRKATLRSNIVVSLDITTNNKVWEILRHYALIPIVVLEDHKETCQTTMTYQDLHKLIETEDIFPHTGTEWEYFFSRVKCLPYAQDLIL